MAIRLTRRPEAPSEQSDHEYINSLVRSAQNGDDFDREVVISAFDFYLKNRAYVYSWSAKRRGIRIYQDDYYEAFQDAINRSITYYDGRANYFTVLRRAIKNAAVDVWRAKTSKSEIINTYAKSFDVKAHTIADPNIDVNPEEATLSRALLEYIEACDRIDDVTKKVVRLYYDGYTLREIASHVGLTDPQQVSRKLRSLRDIVADWR